MTGLGRTDDTQFARSGALGSVLTSAGTRMTSLPSPRRADPEPICCEISRGDDSARILAVGELDVGTAAILSADIESLRSAAGGA